MMNLLGLFQQKNCLLCQTSGAEKLCSGCLNDLRDCFTNATQVCARCAAPSEQAVCGHCQRRPPPFVAMWASTHYLPPMPAIIHEWKHNNRVALLSILHEIMRQNPPKWLPEKQIDGVLAMPMSKKRLWQRGFHQTHELTAKLAADFALPLLPTDVVSRQHRQAQSQLDYAARQSNIRDVFQIHIDVRDQHILLIDDIYTTGATLTELARALHEAGASAVYAWTVSRVLLK